MQVHSPGVPAARKRATRPLAATRMDRGAFSRAMEARRRTTLPARSPSYVETGTKPSSEEQGAEGGSWRRGQRLVKGHKLSPIGHMRSEDLVESVTTAGDAAVSWN